MVLNPRPHLQINKINTKVVHPEVELLVHMGFPGGSDGKEFACNAGDPGSIPGSGNPQEEVTATHSNILAWGSLASYSSLSCKEMDTTEHTHLAVYF